MPYVNIFIWEMQATSMTIHANVYAYQNSSLKFQEFTWGNVNKGFKSPVLIAPYAYGKM